jgi:large subunit ribosomal protein L25
MSEQLVLPAEARDRAGKGASRALRRDGRVPAVIYGEKKEPLSIHVEEKLLAKMLSTGRFMNSVVMVDVAGKPARTLPKAIDFHPVSSRPIHVDFLRIGAHTRSPSRCRCGSTTKKSRPASSAAAFSTSSSTSWS